MQGVSAPCTHLLVRYASLGADPTLLKILGTPMTVPLRLIFHILLKKCKNNNNNYKIIIESKACKAYVLDNILKCRFHTWKFYRKRSRDSNIKTKKLWNFKLKSSFCFSSRSSSISLEESNELLDFKVKP